MHYGLPRRIPLWGLTPSSPLTLPSAVERPSRGRSRADPIFRFFGIAMQCRRFQKVRKKRSLKKTGFLANFVNFWSRWYLFASVSAPKWSIGMGIFVYLPAVQFSTQFLMFCCERNDKREERKFLKTLVFPKGKPRFSRFEDFQKVCAVIRKKNRKVIVFFAFWVKIDANP